jgi:hypothetical protein
MPVSSWHAACWRERLAEPPHSVPERIAVAPELEVVRLEDLMPAMTLMMRGGRLRRYTLSLRAR